MSPTKVTLVCLLVLLTPVVAADVFDDLELHGFVTQGFVKTTDNSFFGDSEDGSFDFREIGVNATVEPTDRLRLSGQVLSRKAGEMSDGSPTVDYAVADLSLWSTPSSKLNLLAGRIKNQLGLFNDTRDVAFTRPGVFLPQTVYFDEVRNLFLSADGVAVSASWYGPSANLSLFAGIGRPLIDENVEYVYLGDDFAGELTPDGPSASGRILLSTPDDRFHIALSMASVSMDFERAGGDLLPNGGVRFRYWVASMQYDAEHITVTAEYLREPIRWEGFTGSFFSGLSTEAESYYIQGAWRVKQDVEVSLRYENGVFDRRDRSGVQFSDRTGGLIPPSAGYSEIWSVGLRIDLSDEWLVMSEYQRHRGGLTLSAAENKASDLRPDWDLFAVTLSYRF